MVDPYLFLANLGEIKVFSFRLITLVAAAGIIFATWYFDIPRLVQKLSSNGSGPGA